MNTHRGLTFALLVLAQAGMVASSAGSGASRPLPDPPGFALGPEELVQYGGVDIVVSGYSVPSLHDWNNDGLPDVVVGEGGGLEPGMVRIYPNTGTPGRPEFDSFFFAQSEGSDLTVPAEGCLGAFPRVVQWDGDARKDLVVGRGDGTITLFLNTGSDAAPAFDGGQPLQVGPQGSKVDIDVGGRATPSVVDWNNDGRKDLVVGALDGHIRLFLNSGSDHEPDFQNEEFVMAAGFPLLVDTLRASPAVADVDGDHRKDLVVGDTDGRLLLWRNIGTDEAPAFQSPTAVASDGAPLDLPSTRSRPSLCDWNGDDLPDVVHHSVIHRQSLANAVEAVNSVG